MTSRIVRCALLLLLSARATAASQALGSVAEDRARLNELWGKAVAAPRPTSGFSWRLVHPDVRLVWNSRIPYSLNDGPLWAGRGVNASVTAGVAFELERARYGLTVVIAPTVTSSQNRPFDILPGGEPGRSTYSSPWHLDGASADLPLRFGDQALRTIDPGETTVALRVSNVSAGGTTSAEWWGPGIRNALVMSNNAAGIPRAFLRTARPVRTPVGQFSAEIELGTLTKSLFFDTLKTSDYRSFSAFVLDYRPKVDSNLTFGIARAVYAPSNSAVPSIASSLNALRPNVRTSANAAGATGGGAADARADQIASVFTRWVFPESGLEVYGEWAHTVLPSSLTEVFETPYANSGFTLGFQWATPFSSTGRLLRLQSELSYLDQNNVRSAEAPVDFYTGRVAPQGYTQRGQIIGAAIGPGGSSQWVAMDEVARSWQYGAFLGRTRWEENALYRQRFATDFSHDVSVYGGIRGALRLAAVDVAADLTIAKRFNYLFQNGYANPGQQGTVDVHNVTLTMRLSPK